MINIDIENEIIQYVKLKNRAIKWNNLPKKYDNYLKQRYSDNVSNNLKESYLRIIYNINVIPKCPICGNPVKYLGNEKNPYNKCCNNKKCSNTLRYINSKKTKFEKYEDEYYSNKEKCKQTKLERYGDATYVNPNKTKQTKLERYGDANYVNHEKCVKTCLERYGVTNAGGTKKSLEKIKNTFLERYGVDSSWKIPEVIEKSKQTKLERYGNPNYVNKYKAIQTSLKRYGVDNPFKLPEIQQKYKQTCLNKYGVDHNWKIHSEHLLTHTTEANDKRRITSLKHFGVDHPSKCKEIINKKIETKRKNHTFNTSKTEAYSYNLIKEKYNDVICQYKSKKYPFCCDFYIPSLDLYIECNYHWTHGGHPYQNNEEDNKTIELWNSKNTKYYNNAINCWTIKDVNKRNTAKKNNLNYIEFWNLNELEKWIS